MERICSVIIRRLLLCGVAFALIAGEARTATPPSEDTIVRIAWAERALIEQLRAFVFELYAERENANGVVLGDQYAFGTGGVSPDGIVASAFPSPAMSRPRQNAPLLAPGFVQMIVPDAAGVDLDYYDWHFRGEELLGDIRTWVFDLQPHQAVSYGAFLGRIWVSTSDLAIVRFDGVYTHDPRKPSPYVHFVSSRTKSASGLWLPTRITVKEQHPSRSMAQSTTLKARVNIWGYHPLAEQGNDDAMLRIPAGQEVTVAGNPRTVPEPHRWYREIERSAIAWMVAKGLLSPAGGAPDVVDNVVHNLLAAGDIDYPWPITSRVLLTSPLEAFTIGDTIVLSKGLIDVLRDEPGLAMVIAPQLAHILLGHHINEQLGFHDLYLHDDADVLKNLTFQRTPTEIDAAEAMALDLLGKSTYRAKLSNAAVFLHAVTAYCKQQPALFQPLFGSPVPGCGRVTPLSRLQELVPRRPPPQGALSLGARAEIDPSSDGTEILDPVPDQVSFQLTPLILIPWERVQQQAEGVLLPPVARRRQPARPALQQGRF